MAKKEKTLKVNTLAGELTFFTDDLGIMKIQLIDKDKHGTVTTLPKSEIPAIVAFLKEFK